MEWQDYVAQLLSQKSSFDGISLSFEDNAHSVGISGILPTDMARQTAKSGGRLTKPETEFSVLLMQ